MESAQILLSLRVEKVDGIWTKVKADLRAIGNALRSASGKSTVGTRKITS